MLLFAWLCVTLGLVAITWLYWRFSRMLRQTEGLVAAQHDLARIRTTAGSSEEAWPLCLEVALRVAGMDSGGIYLFESGSGTLALVTHQGLGEPFVRAVATYSDASPQMRLIKTGVPVYLQAAVEPIEEPMAAEGLRCAAIIPLLANGQLLGVLNVASHTQKRIPAFARRALEIITPEVANLIASLQTEASLRASERQARALVSSLEVEQLRLANIAATIPGAICTFLLTPGGVLSVPYASKAFEEVYGLERAAVAVSIDALKERVPPEHLARLDAAVAESARTMQPWRHEYLYRHPRKGEIWLEGYAVPLHTDDGNMLWHGVTTDITERKRAEQATLRASDQLAAIVEIEHALASCNTEEAIYAIMVDGIQRLLPDITTLFIASYDPRREAITAVAGVADGVPLDVTALPPLPLAPEGEGTQSQVIRSRKPLIVASNLRDRLRPATLVHIDPEKPDSQSALYVPMVVQERVLGLVQVQSSLPERFSAEDAGSLALVANTAAVCLQNVRLYRLAQRELDERNEIEASLRISERHFATIFDASPVGIAISRLRDSRIESANPALLAMLGYTEEQLLGKSVRELGIWESWDERDRLLEHMFQHGRLENVETMWRRRSGERCIVLISGELIALNNEPCILVQAIDISERKRAEEQLRQSEVRFRALIEHAPGALTLVGADGTLSYVSSSTERLMGYRPDEAIGLDPASLTHPDDLPALLALLQELLRYPGMVRKMDYRFRHADGSWRWVESMVSNLLHEPSVGAIAFNFQDITERKHAELALRASEELYRGLMESLDSVVATVDADGRFLYMNDLAARQLGGTAQELIGKTMAELFPAPVAASHLGSIRKVIGEDTALVRENQSFVQGQQRWYRTTIQPIHDETGRAIYVLLNSTDIHDLKAAQEELLRLNQTLEERVRQRTAEVQDLYEHAPTGFHSLDGEGRFVRVNQTELDWLGYTRDELLGRSFGEFVTPASRALFEVNFAEFKRLGQSQDIEYELIRKDGSTFPILLSATAVYDEAGAYVASRSTAFDITRRKEAEDALRASEGQNRLLFEASPEAIVLFAEGGAMVRTNHAFELMAGYPGVTLQGRRLDELGLLASEGSALLATAMAQAQQSDNFAATEFQLASASGTVRDVEARVFGLLIGGGRHYLTALRDITAEKQAARALRQANAELARAARAKDEFLANMSHELRTPLNAILAFSDSLLEGTYGPLSPRQAGALDHVLSSGRHLLALINDILDLSKVEAGRLDLRAEPISIAEVCQASLLFVKEPAVKKNLHLTLHLSDHNLRVVVDPLRLKQMLVNLLSNAVKFTPARGTVTLEVDHDAEAQVVYLAVQDTGIGIAPEDLARLFQPFSQLDSSLSRQYEGTGLGLVLVRRLAELHGGSCTVESEVGVGSRFTIALPYKPLDNEPERPEQAPQEPWLAAPGTYFGTPAPELARVLLVEDNEASVQVIGEYLRARGYEVGVARNGQEALDLVAEVRPELILMDIQMPQMDGIEAITRLRAQPASAAIPVIALTALAMPGDRERCLAAGASAYLTKPVSLKGLVETMGQLLETQR